jgi:hypothetical protein
VVIRDGDRLCPPGTHRGRLLVTDPDLSAKAEQVQAAADALPSTDQIKDLAARAMAHGGTSDMSLDEIRELAVQAVDHAERVTVLLRRLSDLLAPPSAGGDPP